MRIYEGSPRQDFEEVFRSIGAFLDQRGMREVLLVEAPDGFIVQGIVVSGGGTRGHRIARRPGPEPAGPADRHRHPGRVRSRRGLTATAQPPRRHG